MDERNFCQNCISVVVIVKPRIRINMQSLVIKIIFATNMINSSLLISLSRLRFCDNNDILH